MWGGGGGGGSRSISSRTTETNIGKNTENGAVSCVSPACAGLVAGRAGRSSPLGPADKHGGPGGRNWTRADLPTVSYWSVRCQANSVLSGEAVGTGERTGR